MKHVSFRPARGIFLVLISAGLQCAHAQQAVSPVEQARLFKELSPSTNTAVDANGTALADDDSTSDDSLGEQLILKSQPRVGPFVVTGGASVFYTNNVALTRHNPVDDAFFVANVGVSWTSLIAPHLEAQIAARSSIFRYDTTSALDFEDFGLGTGLFWSPDHFAGVELLAYYSFTELISHGEEILREHLFTIGAQKVFPLGRAHAFVTGATVMAGVAEPESAQRDQAGVFLAYRLQVTRSVGVELLYRFAGHFYNDTGRIDRNQILSATVWYRLRDWADINAFFSFADNRSGDSAFNYDAVVNGGGLSATIRF